MKREQERSLNDIKERHKEELEKLEDKLEREAREAEEKELADFEAYRQRALREAKNRQAAELAARNDLSSEETQKVHITLAHFKPVLSFYTKGIKREH